MHTQRDAHRSWKEKDDLLFGIYPGLCAAGGVGGWGGLGARQSASSIRKHTAPLFVLLIECGFEHLIKLYKMRT